MLTVEVAQAVVDAMRADVGYSLNIMDHTGHIIASLDPSRIGSQHPGAVRALATGETVEVLADGPGARRGINLPIIRDGTPIGVVGITGDPDEVRPLAGLVRTTVTLLIAREETLREESAERGRRVLLAERLSTFSGEYPRRLISDAAEFGLDLTRPHVVVLVERVTPDRLRKLLAKESATFSLWPAAQAFVAAEDTALTVARRLLAAEPTARAVVGPSSPNVEESLVRARDAAMAADALGHGATLVTFRELDHLCAVAAVSVPGRPMAIEALAAHPDLIDTLRALVRHDGNMAETASELCIHRNTLAYRLDRISTLTGRNPRSLVDLSEFVVDLVRAQRSRHERAPGTSAQGDAGRATGPERDQR